MYIFFVKAAREPALDQILMALEDRSYDRAGTGSSSAYHDMDSNAENHFNMGDTGNGFDGMTVRHSPSEGGRESYKESDSLASKLEISGNEKREIGGGGGGATFIFKV